MHVVGTAGHIDHGKSTLVQALTGIHPDRLKEEKERQMTIDLGFAWLKPGHGADEIGIVDVPGHRDFIENMLAGVGSIDLALLVIAADEGVMPQTREHLAILDLLDVQSCIIVLTKVDLVDDPEWLDLVILDIYDTLRPTAFAEAAIFNVSAIEGTGIPELQKAIITALNSLPNQEDHGQPRLPIDRIFSLPGFGTIVTGTLTGGTLAIGDAVEIQPHGSRGRIRGLQTHKTKITTALPGSRVAVNVSGLSTDELNRGDVLSHPDTIGSTILCDVNYRHLPDATQPIDHNDEVKLFVGAAETVARVRVLGVDQINRGQSGWLQLALQDATAMARGDRFILRRPSPPETLGGGRIIDPHPGSKYRRFKPDIISRLENVASASPSELVLDHLAKDEPKLLSRLIHEVNLDEGVARQAFQDLIEHGEATEINGLAMTTSGWNKAYESLLYNVERFHQKNPLRLGMPREEARSRLRLPNAVFTNLVDQARQLGSLVDAGTSIRMADHEINFNGRQKEKIQEMKVAFSESGVNSPSVKDAQRSIGADVYKALIDLGELIQISEDVVYAKEEYAQLISQISDYLKENKSASAAEIRDLLDTSRKYAIALLEHLDDIGITRRDGDYRRLAR